MGASVSLMAWLPTIVPLGLGVASSRTPGLGLSSKLRRCGTCLGRALLSGVD